MPCIIITGHPCAGKTTLANKLKERALQYSMIDKVVMINEESVCKDTNKQQSYETPGIEKKTRAALKASFDRQVGQSKSTLIILDSMNYIKGFRYELHCISKASGERHGILWVLNHVKVIEEWNSKRDDGYSPEVLQELIMRYEPPDERNRWDKPLYVVDVTPENIGSTQLAQDALQRSVYNMHALSENIHQVSDTIKRPVKSAFQRVKKPVRPTTRATKPAETTESSLSSPPHNSAIASNCTPESKEIMKSSTTKHDDNNSDKMDNNNNNNSTDDKQEHSNDPKRKKSIEERLDEILDSFLKDVQPLKEGLSTQLHVAKSADVLHEMDSITQRICTAMVKAQGAYTGGKLQITSNGTTYSMNYKRNIALAELRRLRKQYLRWVGTNPPDDTTEVGIATAFLSYVEAHVE